jgi:GDP-L-fucose synthase
MESHVVPAMIRRFFEATRDGRPVVEMWGTGTPTRDFTYAGDVARLVPSFINSFDELGPVNLCTATSTSIRDLAELAASITGYSGEIRWNTSKPDGQMVKIFSNARLKSLGLSCGTPLTDGLKRTAEWLMRNYDSRGEGLRL